MLVNYGGRGGGDARGPALGEDPAAQPAVGEGDATVAVGLQVPEELPQPALPQPLLGQDRRVLAGGGEEARAVRAEAAGAGGELMPSLLLDFRLTLPCQWFSHAGVAHTNSVAKVFLCC